MLDLSAIPPIKGAWGIFCTLDFWAMLPLEWGLQRNNLTKQHPLGRVLQPERNR